MQTLNKNTALFTNITLKQAGTYTCLAENWAGKDYSNVQLIVSSILFIIKLLNKFNFNLASPKIYPEKQNISANINQTVILFCNVTGIPEPTVSWIKVPNTDIEKNVKSKL